jgi:hypothetical protein
MIDYDFSESQKKDVIYSYFIRKCIGKSDSGSPIYYLTRTFIEDKNKLKEIKVCFNEFYENSNKEYIFEKILSETDMNFELAITTHDYDLTKKEKEKLKDISVYDYLSCYYFLISNSKYLNVNEDWYYPYRQMLLKYEELYNNINVNVPWILSDSYMKYISKVNIGFNGKIYNILTSNKENIIKNYFFREKIGELYKENSDGEYSNEGDKYTYFNKINGETLNSINIYSKKESRNENVYLFEKIVSTIYSFDKNTIDVLLIYTNIIDNYKGNDIQEALKKIKDKEWLKISFEKYESIYNNVNRKSKYEDSMEKQVFKTYINILLKEKISCEDKVKINLSDDDFIYKIDYRKIIDERRVYNKNNDIVSINYGLYVYHFIINYKTKNVYLCKNLEYNTEENYNLIMDYINEPYSPTENVLNLKKNQPSGNDNLNILKRRKSLELIAAIDDITKYKIHSVDNVKNTLTHIVHKESKKIKKNVVDPDEILKNTLDCMVNKTKEGGKQEFIPVEANYYRESFMKLIIHFPSNCMKDKDRNDLLQNAKNEMLNALKCIKDKNYPGQDKKYFLIDKEGGGDMHFDYSLYAFTEKQIKEQERDILNKSNLWKKLEFKSNKTATSIRSLSEYMNKSGNQIFKTVKNTFYKELQSFINYKFKKGKKYDKTWLDKDDIKNTFIKILNNNLQSQENKVYIIWNSKEKKIYLDEFELDDLNIVEIEYDIKDNGFDIIAKTKSNKEHVIKIKVKGESPNLSFKFNGKRNEKYEDCK